MLRCDEIMSQLNLSHADAAQLLHSLSTWKCQILQKQTDTIAISRTDIFVYNPTFSPEMGKVMVMFSKSCLAQMKELLKVLTFLFGNVGPSPL